MTDDLISRQAVLEQIKGWLGYELKDMTNPIYYLEKRIKAMPSVTPTETQMIDKSNFSQEQYKMDLQSAYDCGVASTERTGHWIRKDDGNTHCSECDGISYKFEFCPCCGAKMVEPQESEGKE